MKKPTAAPTAATSPKDDEQFIKPAYKIERVLLYMVQHGSINRLEAEKPPVYDHALNSTMSNEVKLRLGLEFTSTPEKAIGYGGLPAIYHRYKLTPASKQKAKQVINDYRLKRGAELISWEMAS
ncbi:hypothetical protein [Pontibacterium sp.]|uniref:hypothetical protein n=1 Tax=Pontibacterium sp. TaxID=2036026 RepID=UPI0035188DFC